MLSTTVASAGDTTVAVAANFTAAARDIAAAFSRSSGHTVTISFGSTGSLYAQIVHGAPVDVLLAADTVRPARAIAAGVAVAGSELTYARGRLALYSRDPTLVDNTGAVLQSDRFRRLALANPATAPYGAAAMQVLEKLGLWHTLQDKLIRGDNIAQTYQFVYSGNAQLGLIAVSQLVGEHGGSRWLVPQDLYLPIRQNAVLLKRGSENPAARAFLEYLRGPPAQAIIQRYGYETD